MSRLSTVSVAVGAIAALSIGIAFSSVASSTRVEADSFTPTPPELTAARTQLRDTSTLRLPLDQFSLTEQQQADISKATILVASNCERRFGVVNTNSGIVETVSVDNSRRYGVTSEPVVAQLGYHPATSGSSTPSIKGEAGEWNPSPGEALVAYGNGVGADSLRDVTGTALPSGGCYGEAWRELAGTETIDVNLVDELARDSSRYAENDTRVRDVFRKWSKCMADAGYNYDNPWAANDDHWDMIAAPSDVEKQTAIADVRCREATNLVGIWSAAEYGYQEELVAFHRSDLEKISAQIANQDRNAQAVITASLR
jgi:hypothetical protein